MVQLRTSSFDIFCRSNFDLSLKVGVDASWGSARCLPMRWELLEGERRRHQCSLLVHTCPPSDTPQVIFLKNVKLASTVLIPTHMLSNSTFCLDFEATKQQISLNCYKGSSMETRWRSLCRVQERQYTCRYISIKIGFLLKTHFQGHLAHAVMNIDENLSVTENLFLPDSLEDWVHGWAEKSLKDLFKAFF